MKIGLTYDLRSAYLSEGYSELETAEFDRDDTVEAIEAAIRSWGHETDRVGKISSLVRRLAAGDRWDLVFNIAEGFRGIGREAQVPALLDAYGIPYTFSDPLVLALTLHKAMTKRVVRDLGIPTAPFALVRDEADVEAVALDFPLFAKPVAEGTGKGVTAASKIGDRGQLRVVCRDLLQTYRQPVLVEAFLPGREFTVGIAGTGPSARVLGVMEVVLLENADRDVYTYGNKEWCEDRVLYRLAGDPEALAAGETALNAWRGLECRDAGRVDVRSDAGGVPNFMEVNPLAGLHPEHSDLPILCKLAGITFRDLIGLILDSALARVSAGPYFPGRVHFPDAFFGGPGGWPSEAGTP
jgi:D-alanine-D-alanine ligase